MLPARSFHRIGTVRGLPFAATHVAISADGSTIAASCRDPDDGPRLWIRIERDGEATQWSLDAPNKDDDPPPIALADDGSWIALMLPGRLVKHDVATGAEIAAVPGTWARELALGRDGKLYAYDDVWRAADLARETLDDSPVPRDGHRSASGNDRWVATCDRGRIVLWDRVARRSSQHHWVPYARSVAFVADRFALTVARRELLVIDLVDGATRRYPIGYEGPKIAAARDGTRIVIWDSRPWILDLEWVLDEADHDPIAERWAAAARPQIIDSLLPDLRSRPAFPEDLQPIVRGHGELELELARWLSPSAGAALTRQALQDPAMVDRPEAWRQLAALSLVAGDSAHAADAAAEALARNADAGDHEVLERALALDRLRTATIARRWQAHSGAVTALALDGDVVVSTGADGRIRTWSLATLERFRSYDCKAPITALDVLAGRAVTGTKDGRLHLFDVETLERRTRVDLTRAAIVAITITAHHVLVIADDDHLYWRTPDLERIARHNYRSGAQLIAFPRAARYWHGDTLLLFERHLERFDTRYMRRPSGLPHFDDPTALATRGPLLVGTLPGTVWLDRTRLDGHSTMIHAVLSAGDLVVAAAFDDTIRWWREGTPVAVAKHPDLTCIASDGNVVLSGDDAGNILIWD